MAEIKPNITPGTRIRVKVGRFKGELGEVATITPVGFVYVKLDMDKGTENEGHLHGLYAENEIERVP